MSLTRILRPSVWQRVSHNIRLQASHPRYIAHLPLSPPSSWSIAKCPSPTCPCATTPENLDIDHEQPLAGKVPLYDQHLILCTGKTDWTSRIEDDEGGSLIKGLKQYIAREYSQQGKNVLITNSSIAAKPAQKTSPTFSTSAYLFPSFRFISRIEENQASYASVAKAALSPSTNIESSDEASTPTTNELVVLICGHGGRDQRCGIMGPLLSTEIEHSLISAGIKLLDSSSNPSPTPAGSDSDSSQDIRARIALISHIGGHKWAGNIILYFSPAFYTDKGLLSPLAGTGIWYGRVEPRHVQGIIQETVKRGKIIKELYRGGIAQESKLIEP